MNIKVCLTDIGLHNGYNVGKLNIHKKLVDLYLNNCNFHIIPLGFEKLATFSWVRKINEKGDYFTLYIVYDEDEVDLLKNPDFKNKEMKYYSFFDWIAKCQLDLLDLELQFEVITKRVFDKDITMSYVKSEFEKQRFKLIKITFVDGKPE